VKKNKSIPSAYDLRPDAAGPVNVTLPILPPSSNHMFVNVPGRGRVKSKEYRAWVAQMGAFLNAACRGRMVGRANVSIFLENIPGADIDNRIKPVLDLLVTVGILADDSSKHVRSVSATWGDVKGLNIQVWPALGEAPCV